MHIRCGDLVLLLAANVCQALCSPRCANSLHRNEIREVGGRDTKRGAVARSPCFQILKRKSSAVKMSKCQELRCASFQTAPTLVRQFCVCAFLRSWLALFDSWRRSRPCPVTPTVCPLSNSFALTGKVSTLALSPHQRPSSEILSSSDTLGLIPHAHCLSH